LVNKVLLLMDLVATSLQNAIQANFRKLNELGMSSVPEVMCNCSLFKNGSKTVHGYGTPPQSITSVPGTLVSTTTSSTAPVVTVTPQFTPGETNSGALVTVDPGNIPFIFPKGITPEEIVAQQEAALAPVVAEAEKQAAAAEEAMAAATAAESADAAAIAQGQGLQSFTEQPSTVSVTTNQAGNVLTNITSPTSTGEQNITVVSGVPTQTIVNTSTNASTENFAPFAYGDDNKFSMNGDYATVPSFVTNGPSYTDLTQPWSQSRNMALQQHLPTNFVSQDYQKGLGDALSISLSSWLFYILLLVLVWIYFYIL
jgi:hypothetical protein